MKFLAPIAVVILIICGGSLWFLASGSLNDYVKIQIETVGKNVTEQTVNVKAVNIELTKGAGTIAGIELSSPEGYSYPKTFSLGELTLDINLESLAKRDPIIIDAIKINTPQAFVQLKKDGSSNIKDIIDAINNSLPATENDASKPTEPNNKHEQKISVKKVVLAGTALSVDFSELGNKQHQLTLPNITLTDIGGSKGLPASQLGSVILKESLSNIWKETKKSQKKQLKEDVKNKLKDKAKEKLSELFK